ncbi:MAG TPA: PASTA domain-containing protein [Saprospiraceae bacterium]|nr:PASTA domain-containing protein [Saprospiraceae bacterium]
MTTQKRSFSEFLRDNPRIKHLLILAGTVVAILLIVFLWLRFYTHHGQKLPMVNLVGKYITEGIEEAEDHSFTLVVTDSVFVVGKKGGIILDQNPKPNAEVKEGRKVYVSITKYDPDKILVSELPLLYGNDFSQKSVELKHRGILSKIKGKKYDAGDPNHILEVYYKGQLIIDQNVIKGAISIDKGDELEFVVSDKEGGEITIPELVCYTLAEAEFLLDQHNLELGEITLKGAIRDTSAAYIMDQLPPFDGITKVPMHSKINITVVSARPAKCN